RAIEGAQRLVEAVVADPRLGGHEELVAIRTILRDGFADLRLVAIHRGGIDQPVAGRDRLAHRTGGLRGTALEHAEPEGRHLDAVVEPDEGTAVGHLLPSRRTARTCLSPGPRAWTF